MAVDARYNQGGTADTRPHRRIQRRKCLVHVLFKHHKFKISSNYASGWCSGDVDWY